MNIETNQNDTTIVDDENTFPNNTNETEKKEKKRIPVLESHVRIALTAIDNTPTNINSSSSDVEEQTKMILQDAKESFKSNILSVVEPTNEYPLPYESMIRRKRHSHAHTDDDSSSSEEEDEEVSLSSSSLEEEYDEDELLDQEAVKRVKELRNEMRTSANRISNLKSNVINQLIQKINQEIHKFQQSSSLCKEEEQMDTHSPQQQKEEEELKVMETSLQKLISRLQSIDTQMPDRLDHLQETIQTIQTTLSSSSSSSVDAAISSRTNEGSTNKKLPTQSRTTTTITESNNRNGNDEMNMDPERRFGQFMYRFTRH